jgi:hypothetical protein
MATNVCVVKTLLTAKRKSNGHFSLNIKGVGPTVFHKKEWPTLIQILVLERDISYFAKNKTI